VSARKQRNVIDSVQKSKRFADERTGAKGRQRVVSGGFVGFASSLNGVKIRKL
jgi:hypothetical protein